MEVMSISFLVEVHKIRNCPSAFETTELILVNLDIGGERRWKKRVEEKNSSGHNSIEDSFFW
jgi:hypothetical protein